MPSPTCRLRPEWLGLLARINDEPRSIVLGSVHEHLEPAAITEEVRLDREPEIARAAGIEAVSPYLTCSDSHCIARTSPFRLPHLSYIDRSEGGAFDIHLVGCIREGADLPIIT